MNKERLMEVLLSSIMSEKSTQLRDDSNQIVFKVLKDANKSEIKQAVELLFNVKVDSVQICNVKGKQKLFRYMPGKRPNWKKAYVRLQEGNDIDFLGAGAET